MKSKIAIFALLTVALLPGVQAEGEEEGTYVCPTTERNTEMPRMSLPTGGYIDSPVAVGIYQGDVLFVVWIPDTALGNEGTKTTYKTCTIDPLEIIGGGGGSDEPEPAAEEPQPDAETTQGNATSRP